MRLFFLALLAVLWAFPGYAETTPWVKLDNSQVRVVAGADDAGKLGAGLGIQLDEGWDTYWRTPGDAGIPVAIDTTGSTNLKSLTILWPVPTRVVQFGNLETFIYTHNVMFPLTVEAENKAAPVHLKMKVKYAACKEICTFLSHEFELDLAADKKLSPEETKLFKEADAKLATPLNQQTDITIVSNALDKDASHIRIEATSLKGFTKPDLYIEGGTSFRFAENEITLSDGNKKAVFLAPVQALMSTQTIADKELTFTLADKGQGVEWKAVPVNVASYGFGHFLLMLGFAIIGGLILNIMPCVLPVLSLKILGVMKKSGKESPIVRRSFLASATGIITSFMVLATLVVGLKAAGQTVGWGFQFQEPYFLIVLSLILTFFAANLFGFFEIRLPQFLSNFELTKSHKSEGYLEHFLTGVFATLLATPCSAPFLGTAIGFAFSQGAFEVFALFFAMGIGLSLPYLAFAAFPKLVKLLPKPGAWMVKAKLVLGALLLATAVWVLWVLASQEGVITSLAITVMLAMLIIAFKLPKKLRLGTVAALTIVCLLLPMLLMEKHEEQQPAEAAVSTDLWQDFDLGRVKTLVADGNVVLVDVTADWCLTCKANKLLVLDTAVVVDLLKMPHTVAMKADWTNRDQAIADYLKTFGRYGIPFNVVYGPGAPKGIALPELLSEDKLRKALEKARGGAAAKDEQRPSELP
jgi:suppressor for copper-sensitivity B